MLAAFIFAQNHGDPSYCFYSRDIAELFTLNSQTAVPLLTDRLKHKVLTIGIQLAEVGRLLIGGFWFAPIFLLVSILLHRSLC